MASDVIFRPRLAAAAQVCDQLWRPCSADRVWPNVWPRDFRAGLGASGSRRGCGKTVAWPEFRRNRFSCDWRLPATVRSAAAWRESPAIRSCRALRSDAVLARCLGERSTFRPRNASPGAAPPADLLSSFPPSTIRLWRAISSTPSHHASPNSSGRRLFRREACRPSDQSVDVWVLAVSLAAPHPLPHADVNNSAVVASADLIHVVLGRGCGRRTKMPLRNKGAVLARTLA